MTTWRSAILATQRHVRIAIAIGAVVGSASGTLWTIWLIQELAAPLSGSGHHDFFAFYAAASLVRAHHAGSLYSATTLTALERHIYPRPTGYAGYLPFLNPPVAAAILSPLAELPFSTARIVWLLVTIAVAVACVLLLTRRTVPRVRVAAVVLVLVSFPAYQTLVEGQWSFVMLLGALLALMAARRQHPWLAGLCVGVFWLKPPLLLFVVIWCLATRNWRIAAGAVITVVAVTLIALPWTGWQANIAYAQYLGGVSLAHVSGGGAAGPTSWEGAFANMEGLLGAAAAIVGQQNSLAVDVLTAVFDLISVALLAYAMHGRWTKPLPLGLAVAAVSLGLLLDPHLYAQDCVLILVIAALLLFRVEGLLPKMVLGLRGLSPAIVVLSIVVATVFVMDLSAIDTLWIQGEFPLPLHLLTLVLFVLVAMPAWQRWRLTRSAAH